MLPCLTLIAGLIAQEPNSKKKERRLQDSQPLCMQAKKNWLRVWQYLKLPSMYKPLIFIFLVVVAPGITDAMFYF